MRLSVVSSPSSKERRHVTARRPRTETPAGAKEGAEGADPGGVDRRAGNRREAAEVEATTQGRRRQTADMMNGHWGPDERCRAGEWDRNLSFTPSKYLCFVKLLLTVS